MNEQTFTKKLDQFIIELVNHSHYDELLSIMQEQVRDDTEFRTITSIIK